MKTMKKVLAMIVCLAMIFTVVGCKKEENKSNESALESEATVSENNGFDLDNVEANTVSQSEKSNSENKTEKKSNNSTKGKKVSGNSGITYEKPLEINNIDQKKYSGIAKNLKGKTVRVHLWQPYMTGKDPDKPLLVSRYKELCQKIEKQLNCKIINVEGWNDDADIVASVASGKPSVDIWWVNVSRFLNAYKAGYLTKLDSLDVFDFKDRSRFSHATEMCRINGTYYGVAPRTYGIIPIYTNRVMFANIDLLEKCGVSYDTLYSLQKDKKWNWDTFKSVLEKVKANNGKNGFATYAINDTNTSLYQGLMIANGVDWVTRSNNGNYSFSGDTKPAQNVLKYYSSLYKDGLIAYDAADQGKQFSKGETAFYCGGIYSALFMGGSWKFNYSMMYYPIGNDVKNYTSAGGNYSFAVIPKGSKPSGCTDAEIATVLNYINTGLVNEQEDLSMMATDYAFAIKNKLSKETLEDIYAEGVPKMIWSEITVGTDIGDTDGRNGWYGEVQSIAKANGSNIASVINSVKSSYNAKLASMFKIK